MLAIGHKLQVAGYAKRGQAIRPVTATLQPQRWYYSSCSMRSGRIGSRSLSQGKLVGALPVSHRRNICCRSATSGAGPAPEGKPGQSTGDSDTEQPKELTPEEIEAKRQEDEDNRAIAAECFKYIGIVFLVVGIAHVAFPEACLKYLHRLSEPATSLVTYLARVFGFTLALPAAVTAYCVRDACINDRMGSSTYQRMNLILCILGLFATINQFRVVRAGLSTAYLMPSLFFMTATSSLMTTVAGLDEMKMKYPMPPKSIWTVLLTPLTAVVVGVFFLLTQHPDWLVTSLAHNLPQLSEQTMKVSCRIAQLIAIAGLTAGMGAYNMLDASTRDRLSASTFQLLSKMFVAFGAAHAIVLFLTPEVSCAWALANATYGFCGYIIVVAAAIALVVKKK
mmetsp:Transcript_1065/g.3747  ORF Transcript_1065/g.3747 Transcript_1065/m.3747 type:complete len:394 (+) Transcript_1065:66-1247(+)